MSAKPKNGLSPLTWAPITVEMTEGPAFNDLTLSAVKCLLRFHQKAHRKIDKKRGARTGREGTTITNNGQILFTYSEAEKVYGMSSSTFRAVIRELSAYGFVNVHFSNVQKEPTRFSISDRWKKWGTPDFKENPIPRRLPTGVGFQPKTKRTAPARSKPTAPARSKEQES